jgi:hypothetical protein
VVALAKADGVQREREEILHNTQVEIMGEGVHVGQVFELVTLIGEDMGKLKRKGSSRHENVREDRSLTEVLTFLPIGRREHSKANT